MRLRATDRLLGIVALVILAAIVGGGVVTAQDIGGGAVSNPQVNASALTTGTLPDGRFPATLPAVSGANLTNLDASDLASGTVPDARLSGNVALESVANVFTTSQSITTATNSRWSIVDTTAAGLPGIAVGSEGSERVYFLLDIQGGQCGANGTALSACVYTQGGPFEVAISGTGPDFRVTDSAITGLGVDMTPASGTITASFDSACTTTPTVTFDYQRIGNIVQLSFTGGESGFPCTGDTNSFATTGAPLPTSLRPAVGSHSNYIGGFVNNGAAAVACMGVGGDGNIFFSRAATFGDQCSTAGWTASGNRDADLFAGQGFSYMLGNP